MIKTVITWLMTYHYHSNKVEIVSVKEPSINVMISPGVLNVGASVMNDTLPLMKQNNLCLVLHQLQSE